MKDNPLPGDPPCDKCSGCCCKSTRRHAVELLSAEVGKYDREDYDKSNDQYGIPTEDGRCVYLGDDDRCTIYEDRPELCREFTCLYGLYMAHALEGEKRHSFLLEDNPQLVTLLTETYPEWAEKQKEFWKERHRKQKA